MSVNPRDLLFYAGGECLQRFGTLVWRPRLAHDLVPTFTRSGSVGPFIGSDGVLRQASANRPRIEWVNGTDPDGDGAKDTPGLLLEQGATNLVTSDDITTWTAGGTPVVTGSVDDPAGGTGAYTIEDADGAALEFVVRNISFTGDAAKSLTFVVRENTMPASGQQVLKVRDITAGADRLLLSISSWTGGEPSVTATTGTLLGKRYVGNGYWAIYGLSTTITAANTNRVEILPASGDSAYTGIIDVYRVNTYNSTVGPASILDASETLGADAFYAPFTAKPQAMTVYVKFVELGAITDDGNSSAILNIGDGTTYVRLYKSPSVNLYGATGVVGGTATTAIPSITDPAIGDIVEMRMPVTASGQVTCGISVNAGAEATDLTSVDPGASGWSFGQERLWLNYGATAPYLILSAKVAAGVKTMAEMRSVFPRAAS